MHKQIRVFIQYIQGAQSNTKQDPEEMTKCQDEPISVVRNWGYILTYTNTLFTHIQTHFIYLWQQGTLGEL